MGAARGAGRAGNDRGDRRARRCAACGRAGVSCSRLRTARADEARELLEAFGYQDVVVTADLDRPAARRRGPAARPSVEEVVAALRAGRPAILPTDTVYGLCARARRGGRAPALRGEGAAARSSRPRSLGRDVDALLALVPELGGEHRSRSCAPCCRGRTRSSCRTRRGACRGWREATRTRSACACRTRRRHCCACSSDVPAVAATSANLPGGARPGPPAGRAAPRSARSSTAATCPACRRPSSTSPATSRASCAKAPCRPTRRSVGFGARSRRAR